MQCGTIKQLLDMLACMCIKDCVLYVLKDGCFCGTGQTGPEAEAGHRGDTQCTPAQTPRRRSRHVHHGRNVITSI